MKSGSITRRLAWTALAFTSLLSAQTKEDVISSTTEIVTVPVVVTDKSGTGVRGLKKEDFQIRDSGKEQRIASFEEVTGTPLAVGGSKEQNGIYTNRLNNVNPVALGIVVIDFVNTQTVSQAWAFRGAIGFLNKWKEKGGFQQPVMLAAITSRGLQIIHQATSSPEVLEAALLTLKPTPSTVADKKMDIAPPVQPAVGPDNQPVLARKTNEDQGDYDQRVAQTRSVIQIFEQMNRSNESVRVADLNANTRTTMWALTAIANGVAGIPGRKAMIWCSEGFPFRAVPGMFETPQWVSTHGSTDEDPELQLLREGALLAFNRANISVYPINVAGLLSPEFFDSTSIIGPQWSAKTMRSQGVDQDNRAYAHLVANQTSGFDCMSSNDIANCIAKALDDASHYYMLSYYPDPKPKGTGYRKIKVEVKGDKLNVRGRESYWYGAIPSNGISPKSELAVALGSNLDYTALPIVFRFTGLKPGQGKQIAQFVIGIDGRALSIDEEHGNHISLLIGAQAKAGDSPTLMSIDTKLKPELVSQIRAKQLTHKGEMELAPGKYEVRLVVRDNLSGRNGSIVAPIEVP
jgi:VWFA-related protein